VNISDVVRSLEAIKAAHGDLPVLHENDWNNFLVERVEFEPFRDGTDPIENCKQPAHVVLYGERSFYDCDTGELT
jgi:hypothetical protein